MTDDKNSPAQFFARSILAVGLEQIDAAMLKCWTVHAHGKYDKTAFKELQRVIEGTSRLMKAEIENVLTEERERNRSNAKNYPTWFESMWVIHIPTVCIEDKNMFNYREKGQVTVAELVAELLKEPQDALVWHEGCDCYGAASTVKYDETDKSVLIGRCN